MSLGVDDEFMEVSRGRRRSSTLEVPGSQTFTNSQSETANSRRESLDVPGLSPTGLPNSSSRDFKPSDSSRRRASMNTTRDLGRISTTVPLKSGDEPLRGDKFSTKSFKTLPSHVTGTIDEGSEHALSRNVSSREGRSSVLQDKSSVQGRSSTVLQGRSSTVLDKSNEGRSSIALERSSNLLAPNTKSKTLLGGDNGRRASISGRRPSISGSRTPTKDDGMTMVGMLAEAQGHSQNGLHSHSPRMSSPKPDRSRLSLNQSRDGSMMFSTRGSDDQVNLEMEKSRLEPLSDATSKMGSKVKSSVRLKDQFVNRLNRDDLATVGYYSPYPMSWFPPLTPSQRQTMKGWGLMGDRFPQILSNDKLGPGFYEPVLFKSSKSVSSSFTSTSGRFLKPPPVCSAAPGSYNVNRIVVKPGLMPWVKGVHSRLGRMIEAPEPVIFGTPSRLLEKLSVEGPLSTFIERKKKMEDKLKPPEESGVRDNAAPLLQKQSQHPYSSIYLVAK